MSGETRVEGVVQQVEGVLQRRLFSEEGRLLHEEGRLREAILLRDVPRNDRPRGDVQLNVPVVILSIAAPLTCTLPAHCIIL